MERTIDTFELARSGAELSGETPLAGMSRLGSMLSDVDGSVAWRLRGWRAARPEGGADDCMALSIAATLRMPCVRCMGPVPVELSAERAYRIVRSEAEAERLDLDDQQYDVLAGDRRFDLAGLVEDEAIMALPLAPRHERCDLPAQGALDAEPAAEAGRPSPFAALARLKNGTQNTDIIED
ncbi:MAG TPA: YceD family protein [Zeimonas sp.]|nr:YceD family protein [Zeimonas sp.]